MLFNLGEHLELVSRLRKVLWRTLAYPLMVIAAMSGVLLFISLFVLPQFRVIFKDFRTTLPAVTEWVLAAGDIYPIVLAAIGVVILAIVITMLILRLTGKAGLLTDRLLWLPIIGSVLRVSLLARWIDALRLSIEAGLDLPHAAALASDATASPRLAQESKLMTDLLVSGQPAHLFTGRLIPQTVPTAIELASRASGSGSDLQSTLATLTRMYQQQADHRIRLVPVLVTPLALFVMASVVMTAVAAMFLPLVKLIQSVSGGEG
jgi:type IV pilus assembly protein PilC